MVQMKQVKAIVRNECVPDLIFALKGAEVARLNISRVHAVGVGVDPEDFRASLDEGGVYTEKTKVEFLCSPALCEQLLELVRDWACTGHREDGIIIVSEVGDVVNIRTGEHDRIALL